MSVFNGVTVSVLDPDSSFSSLGTITEVITGEGVHPYDRAGYGSVVIPISATNADLLARDLVVYAYTTSSIHGNPMEIATFIIKKIEPIIQLGRMVLNVSGPDLLHELKGRNIADNIIANVITTTLAANVTAEEVVTTLASTASGGAASVSVSSATGFDEGQTIVIELDAGGNHSSLITNVSGTTITFADNLPSTATSGNDVTTETGFHITVTSATNFAVGQPVFITLDSGDIHVATITAVSGTDITLSTGFEINPDLATVATSGNTVITHAVALDDIEQIMAFAPSSWNTPANNTPNGSYIVGAGESVLEALDLAKEQGGGHYRLKVSPVPVREVVWLDSPDSPGSGGVTDLVMPGSATHADMTDDEKGIILSLSKSESEQFEQVTRIFARGAGGLKFTAAENYISVVPGFTVDWEQSEIIQSVNESGGAVRNERYVTFGGISPGGDSAAEELQAAINLYNAAFNWLNNRQQAPTYYDVTCIVHQQIKPFSLIQLTYSGPGLDIDEELTVHEVTYSMAEDGKLITHVKLGDNETWQELDNSLYTATAIKDINTQLRHITAVRNSSVGTAIVNDVALTTPGTLTSTSTNSSTGNHTHSIDSTIARSNITITGTGSLGGGGDLTANRTITLNTPGSTTSTSTNSSATNHTHAADSTLARSNITITGTGSLGGGGDLTANRTITLNTPGTLTVSTTNSSATNHTHAITSSNSITTATAVLMATDSNGRHRVRGLGVGAAAGANSAITLPADGWIGLGAAAGRVTFVDATNDLVRVLDADLHLSDGTGDRLQLRRSGDVVATESDIYAHNHMGLAADDGVHIFIDGNNDTTDTYFSVRKNGQFISGSTELLRVTEAGWMGIGDTVDADVTVGLTINQGANDDNILSFKSSDVAHGITDFAETDTFGSIRKTVATTGGMQVLGLGESNRGIDVRGMVTSTDAPTSGSSSLGPIVLQGELKSGTGTAILGSNANVVVIRNRTAAVWMVDTEGDTHRDGSDNTFDAFDDAQLARAFDLAMSPEAAIRSEFDDFLKYGRNDLIAAGVLHDCGFYNESQLIRLHNGAIWQAHLARKRLEQRIDQLERRLTNGL